MSKIQHNQIELRPENIKFIALEVQLKDNSFHKIKLTLNQLKEWLMNN